jgi:hypothetical protein
MFFPQHFSFPCQYLSTITPYSFYAFKYLCFIKTNFPTFMPSEVIVYFYYRAFEPFRLFILKSDIDVRGLDVRDFDVLDSMFVINLLVPINRSNKHRRDGDPNPANSQ